MPPVDHHLGFDTHDYRREFMQAAMDVLAPDAENEPPRTDVSLVNWLVAQNLRKYPNIVRTYAPRSNPNKPHPNEIQTARMKLTELWAQGLYYSRGENRVFSWLISRFVDVHGENTHFRRERDQFFYKTGLHDLFGQAEAHIYFGLQQFIGHGAPVDGYYVPTSDSLKMEVTRIRPDKTQEDPTALPLLILSAYNSNGKIQYADLAQRYLAQRKGPVYILHWPGHGASDDINGKRYYAESASDYLKALRAFWNDMLKKHPETDFNIFAHSMGAGIVAADALGMDGAPVSSIYDRVNEMMFMAPMFGFKGSGAFSQWLYKYARWALKLIALRHPEPEPKTSAISKSTTKEGEAKRIVQQQVLAVADDITAQKSKWILAGNEIIHGVQVMADSKVVLPEGIKHVSLVTAAGDTTVDAQAALSIAGRITRKGPEDQIPEVALEAELDDGLVSAEGDRLTVHHFGTNVAHRIQTHPGALTTIMKALGR